MDPARLAKIPLFAELTLGQQDVVAGACTEVEVDEGATLLEEGDFGYAMLRSLPALLTSSRTAS